jgi:hypothetical protein
MKIRELTCRILIALFFIPGLTIYAQKPKGVFLQDSLSVGKPINFSLSYLHHPSQDVFFPDSTYDFSPFRFVSETFITTKTHGGKSLDSVVYSLVSYEIDSIQRLRLPVYILGDGDSLKLFGDADSVFFKEMVNDKDLENENLRANLRYSEVSEDIDYPKILYYLLIVLVIAGGFLFLFGNFISIQYRLWLFNRKHREFVVNFKKSTRNPRDVAGISQAVISWKKHIEWLEQKPFTSLTTQEILKQMPNERLEDALKEVDSAIYGGVISTQIPFAFHIMFDVASDIFKKQRSIFKEKLNK